MEQWYTANAGVPVEFSVVLCNFYENGRYAIGWHTVRRLTRCSAALLPLGAPICVSVLRAG